LCWKWKEPWVLQTCSCTRNKKAHYLLEQRDARPLMRHVRDIIYIYITYIPQLLL
jgi:hypothetical protein